MKKARLKLSDKDPKNLSFVWEIISLIEPSKTEGEVLESKDIFLDLEEILARLSLKLQKEEGSLMDRIQNWILR